MSCAAIMTTNPVTLGVDEDVGAAAAKLIAHNAISLPVVDAEGHYAGQSEHSEHKYAGGRGLRGQDLEVVHRVAARTAF